MIAILPTNQHLSAELVRRCEARQMCTATTAAAAVLGAAVDAGIISLPDLLDMVRSCATADQLGEALAMLAATAYDPLPVGCPPGQEHRVFRIVGEREEVPTWTR